MFKSIIFSKVFKHEPNRGNGKGCWGKMTVPVDRTWLVCDSDSFTRFLPHQKIQQVYGFGEKLAGFIERNCGVMVNPQKRIAIKA